MQRLPASLALHGALLRRERDGPYKGRFLKSR
jgi:hypothetical protein